jgi:DNA-binding NarL/FixJ family response regulator
MVITHFLAKTRQTYPKLASKRENIAVSNMANKRAENRSRHVLLTAREREVVRLVSNGLSNKLVAHRLGLREGTVKIHLHNVYRKLRIPNRMTLIATAIRAHNDEVEALA